MRADLAFALVLGVGLSLSACRPASVEAVHGWLTAYGAEDVDAMVAHTWSGDRDLVRDAMAATRTSTLGMALPPRPLAFELIEIEDKAPGRHTVLARVEMKNPLAYVAEKVGQDLPDVPKRRPEQRRFLSVQEGETWGVKLDLAAAVRRVEFAAEVQRLIDRRRFDEAEARLKDVPPPPDEANALKRSDRLSETLQARLARGRTRTSTRGADHR